LDPYNAGRHSIGKGVLTWCQSVAVLALGPPTGDDFQPMGKKQRDLVTILYEMDRAECVLRHVRLGLTDEDPLLAMKRLGELARELEELGHAFENWRATGEKV